MAVGELLGSTGFSLGGLGSMITIGAIVLCTFLIIGGIFYYFWNRKQWNLEVEFIIPRQVQYLKPGELLDLDSIQGSITSEVSKGSYNTKKGAVFLKRKGKPKCTMKPFNVNEFIFEGNKLKVVQVGAEDYIPVVPKSFMIYQDDSNGQMAALLKLRADTSISKPWKNSFERDAKKAFSISNFLREHQTLIMVGLVIFLWGIQTLIIYNRLK